jgi:hypothetical protein
MGLFEILSFAHRIWPVPVGLLVAAALLYAPQLTADLIQREAAAKTDEITKALEQALLPPTHHKAKGQRHPRAIPD